MGIWLLTAKLFDCNNYHFEYVENDHMIVYTILFV